MKTLAGSILCGAALVLVSAPGFASAHGLRRIKPTGMGVEIPTPVLTDGSGIGTGTYRLPPTGTGSANLKLYDATGALVYIVRADLVRSAEFPPAGEPEQGGFHGILIQVEADGSRVPVALILGKWVLEANGTGSFGVDILVATGEGRDDRLSTVGAIQGLFRARPAVPGPTGSPEMKAHPAAAAARLSATWAVAQ